jgi:hypothetical protein
MAMHGCLPPSKLAGTAGCLAIFLIRLKFHTFVGAVNGRLPPLAQMHSLQLSICLSICTDFHVAPGLPEG